MVVWAGMRGAVTVAAVQLLPPETPHRPLLVFIAFATAAASLVIQGGTVGLLARKLFPRQAAVIAPDEPAERGRILVLLDDAAAKVVDDAPGPAKTRRLAVLHAQRRALLDAGDDGLFDAEALERALLDIDIDELVIELRSSADER